MSFSTPAGSSFLPSSSAGTTAAAGSTSGVNSGTNTSGSTQSQVPLEEYATAPQPQNMFKPLKVKAVVEDLLKAKLEGVKYETSETTKISTELANLIRTKLKNDLHMPRYKIMVQVIVGENKGAGVRMGSRCLWDSATDGVTQAYYSNESLYCCAVIFGMYLY